MPPRFVIVTIPKETPTSLADHLNSSQSDGYDLHSILDYPDLYLVVWEAK
jgi:hypothetical protein